MAIVHLNQVATGMQPLNTLNENVDVKAIFFDKKIAI